METLLPMAGKELLSQGLMGVIIFFLIWYLGQVKSAHKDEIRELKAEIERKDKRIEQLQDLRLDDAAERLSDTKQMVEIAQGLRTQGQAFLAAIERKT